MSLSLIFVAIVCRSSPVRGSHVAGSRPCRLSAFTPNRASLFCYRCSYMYFILVGPFCFGLFVFHLAPGADFVCVWGPGPLVSGSRFCFGKIVRGIRSKTVRLQDPGFCLKPSISVYVRDRLALGACSLFGTNFCWFGSRSRFSFLWNERLFRLRSETVRLRESV